MSGDRQRGPDDALYAPDVVALFGRGEGDGVAGPAGDFLNRGTRFLIGRAFFLTPFIFVFAGVVFFATKYKKFFGPTILAITILILGISGLIILFCKI